MNEVEFNGNKRITIDSICEFLIAKIIENNSNTNIIKNFENSDIILNISKIINNPATVTSKQLLEVIKILLPYKIMAEFGGQVIHIHFEEEKQQHFKYELTNGNLYLYNNFLSKEYQRKIKVIKINNISIKEILDRLNLDINVYSNQIAQILMHPELLSGIGIDTTNGYNVTLNIDNQEIDFSLSEIKNNMDFTVFVKEKEPAQILSKENFNPNQEFIIGEDYTKKLIYSYDSTQKLLQMLLGLSKNKNDLNLFNKTIQKQPRYNIKSKSDKYLDWMFISTFLIFNDQKISDLSDDEYEKIILSFARESNSYFLDEKNQEVSKIGLIDIDNIGNNNYLLKENSNMIDYKELIKAIRNSLAHSEYEVIDEYNIRCYGTNFNVIVDKKIVMKIMTYLINNVTLYNLFPLFYVKEILYNRTIENEAELIKFLNNISYISQDEVTIIKDKIDDDFKSRILSFKHNNHSKSLIGTKGIIKFAYKSTNLGEYLDIPLTIEKEDKNIDIEYVIKEIRKYGDDFYKHSIIQQHHIIMEIIKQKESLNKLISTKIFNIINTENKTTGNIIDTIAKVSPIEYINYSQYVEATFISYLNSLLVFPCNNRFHKLNCKEMSLDKKMNIPLILDKKNKPITKEKLKQGQESQLKQKENRLLKLIQLKEKKEERLNTKKIELMLNKNPEHIKKIKKEIEEIENGQYEKYLENEINMLKEDIVDLDKVINNKYHQIVIEHLRNSLVHGRISFPQGLDFNDIANTIILFEDYDNNNIKTFEGTIKISYLISELNNDQFLLSVFPPELTKPINIKSK